MSSTFCGWSLVKVDANASDDNRRVRDVDLGQRLGFDRERAIRDLIKRHMPFLRELGEVPMRPAVRRIEIGPKNARRTDERTVNEYWLNKDQALYLTTQSGTELAREVTTSLIKAYNQLREFVARQVTGAERSYQRLLLEQRRTPERLWSTDIPREMGRLYGWDMSDVKGFPVWAGNITARIYNLIVGKDVMDEARRRRDAAGGHASNNLLHHWFSNDVRKVFEDKAIDTIFDYLVAAADVTAFWSSMERKYRNSMMQLALWDDGGCARCGAPKEEGKRFCGMCGARY